jgi:hypothetical protein
MDNQYRTLGQVIYSPTQFQETQQGGDLGLGMNVSNYLTVLSINLIHRFPDVTDLNCIEYEQIRRISEFSYACTRVALETWNEITLRSQGRQRLRPQNQTTSKTA